MLLKLGKWNVRIVNTGDTYGRAMCLTNYKAPMVEFYDISCPDIQYGAYGQFVSRYYISTILSQDSRGGEYSNGLCLDGRVPAWQVSAEDMAQVITFLKEHNGNT
jgi:hypothetical protein